VDRPAQLREAVESYSGKADCSFAFDVKADAQNLYIDVAVTDEEVRAEKGKLPWEKQDGIEIRLDARPNATRGLNPTGGEGKDFIAFAFCPGSKSTDEMVYLKEKLPAGSRFACVQTKTGYTARVAVPLSYIRSIAGDKERVFRLNVQVDDTDGDLQRVQLNWKPDWRTPGSGRGDGLFELPE
jgi:hypothetical protein